MVLMRKLLPLVLVLIILASGCLIKQPARVSFKIDKTVLKPGEDFHVIVTINNTGKVALVGANLLLKDDRFQVLQAPRFPSPLKVGESVELMWILKAPEKPGVYNLYLPLELEDELHRSWGGFYGQFSIRVVKGEVPIPSRGVEMNITVPPEVSGGSEFDVEVSIYNRGANSIDIYNVSLSLLDGMSVVERGRIPSTLQPKSSEKITYRIKAPYRYVSGYISATLRYVSKDTVKTLVESSKTVVIWKPWNVSNAVLMKAYGTKYHWITDEYIVDAYWNQKYNSTSRFNRTALRPYALPLIRRAKSDYEAAVAVYNWISWMSTRKSGNITLDPMEMIERKESFGYTEGQILFTAMMRSLNIPSRIVSLYNGEDCTIDPVSEVYISGKWYVVDFRHGFIGTRDDYLATPYFPRIYQLLTEENYKLVAQSPEEMKGHEHVDVTPEYLVNIDERLSDIVFERLNPTLRSKVNKVLLRLDENERLYALFLFASAPEKDLNNVLGNYSEGRIEKRIKVLYEFYKNMPWSENFMKYWKLFAGEE
ncbi:transglutaminase domain-containing protein [Thermococcus sp.]